MYVPTTYRPPEPGWVLDVVRSHPLALLVSGGGGDEVPFATHLPAIPADQDGPADGSLVGRTVLGHLNRENPHWSALTDGGRALLVFTGPGSYVSPTVYGVTPAAPTWDFVSVHVRGTVRLVRDRDATLDVVRRTVAFCEERFGDGWQDRDSVGYFDRILPGVGAFELVVEAVDGMFKLSQEQSPALRERVLDAFERGPTTQRRELARLMRGLPESGEGVR
ncbi:FMN-binding negative transcriptional regulator [Saccharothrix lopnurensis]|uniref:FMN-binding negative transcriptional regulator n=1 Tax=Saccharothrix lopnurensis TaxID=1670621 RepID=A0ABW1PIS3_9PSEU